LTSGAVFTLTKVAAGDYIYFGVDRNGDSSSDATEITWHVRRTGP
jgi:hypothetical protein